MRDRDQGRMFQGNELPRMLLLMTVAVAGWAALWYYASRTPPEPAEPQLALNGPPAAIVADASPEFETVSDKTPIAFRDMSAYKKLLIQARDAAPLDLAAKARRDVFFTHLWDTPKEFRGVPIHIVGTARKILYYKSNLSASGWLYEAWVITPESQNHPYVCVFEAPPKGLPIGQDVSERISFNGYFMKLMKYESEKTPRAAPLLIGRIGWTPRRAAALSPNYSVYWFAGALVLMALITLARWSTTLRRAFTPKPRPSLFRAPPTDHIDPETLSSYLSDLSQENQNGPPLA